MRINPKIFRAYDIRGVYPKDLNESTAYSIGRAFVKFLKKPKLRIVIARDNRISSPSLHKNLIKGITDSGASVVDIGLSTTPMFYFAAAHYKYDGGIIVTASHNPAEYNGFKIVRENAVPISGETGIKEIQKLTQFNFEENKNNGKVVEKEILKDYIDFNLKNIKNLKSFKIVIDTANAVSGIVIPELFKTIPGKIYHLFSKFDGKFPNHSPDPLVKKNLKALQKEVKNKKADLGVAFDGDGDRIIFVDEKAEIIAGDIITALIASLILKDNAGKKILYDVRSSNIIKETVEKAGGKAIVGRIGHSFIKERMRKENIIFAGEFSGHYYHKDHYFCEAPIFVFLEILKEMSKTSISQLVKPYRKYFHSGEINFKVENKEAKLRQIKNSYKGGKILEIDGLRVDYRDWWFLVRLSNTEPVLRLVVEANTKSLLEEKKKELTALIER